MNTNDTTLQNILKNSRPYEEGLIEDLKDPEEARAYLEAVLEEYKKDGDERPLLRALQYVSEAQDGKDKLHELGFNIRVEQREREEVAV